MSEQKELEKCSLKYSSNEALFEINRRIIHNKYHKLISKKINDALFCIYSDDMDKLILFGSAVVTEKFKDIDTYRKNGVNCNYGDTIIDVSLVPDFFIDKIKLQLLTMKNFYRNIVFVTQKDALIKNKLNNASKCFENLYNIEQKISNVETMEEI